MKKNNKSLDKNYPCVKLYLDDVKEIISILNEVNSEKIIIQTDGASYDDNEINMIPKNEHIKYIKGEHYPSYSLYFGSPFYVSISCPDDSITSYGVMKKIIDNVLKKRKRTAANILCSLATSLFIETFVPIITFISFLHNIFPIWAPILIPLFVLFILHFIQERLRGSKFCLTNSFEQTNFFVRNKDNFILGIIFTIFGAYLSVLFPRLMH